MSARLIYPFTAIVGQDHMKLGLLLNAIHPSLGGVLIGGEKGSAKSTAVRALTALLPEIDVVVGCSYSCDPAELQPCDECSARRSIGPLIERARRRIPMVDLPIGATPDRILGSLDAERAAAGLRAFSPGLLARAHRGILYIDEANLLGDELVDLLLDAAALGQNVVERDGFSISHPAKFMLVGTMNPEEGQIRPQLTDRFALVVDAERTSNPAQRAEVIRRRMAFEADPAGFIVAWDPAEQELRERLVEARERVSQVTVPDALVDLIAHVCAASDASSLRADLAAYRAACAMAAFDGRTGVALDDVRTALALALPHRQRSHTSRVSESDMSWLDALLLRALEGGAATRPPRDIG